MQLKLIRARDGVCSLTMCLLTLAIGLSAEPAAAAPKVAQRALRTPASFAAIADRSERSRMLFVEAGR